MRNKYPPPQRKHAKMLFSILFLENSGGGGVITPLHTPLNPCLLTRLLEPHLKQVCLLAKLLAVQPRHTQSPGRISRLSPLALSAPHWSDLTFSVFRSPHLPLDTPFWTRGFPLVMRSRKAGFPFATRARKREPCHAFIGTFRE